MAHWVTKVNPNATSASRREPGTAASSACKGDVHLGVLVCCVSGTYRGSSCRKGQVQSLPIPSNSSSKKLGLWKTEFPSIKPN